MIIIFQRTQHILENYCPSAQELTENTGTHEYNMAKNKKEMRYLIPIFFYRFYQFLFEQMA